MANIERTTLEAGLVAYRASEGVAADRVRIAITAAVEAETESLRRQLQGAVEALRAYRSALRSGEPESDQLRALSDAVLGVHPTTPGGQ